MLVTPMQQSTTHSVKKYCSTYDGVMVVPCGKLNQTEKAFKTQGFLSKLPTV